jgi:hypothetical protein
LKGERVILKKRFLKNSLAAIAAAALCVSLCSNPTKQTLKWRSNIELPVTNTAFVLGKEFQNLFGAIDSLKDFAMLGTNDTTVDGDTTSLPHVVAFSKSNKDTFSFQQKQDTMGNKTFTVSLGPIPLSSAGNINATLVFGILGVIPTDAQHTATATISLPKIRKLIIDGSATNGRLPVRVTNTTATTIDSVLITLADVLPSAPSLLLGTIAPGAFVTGVFDVAGKVIDSTVQIQINAILKAGGSIAAGSGLDVSLSLSNVKASSAIVQDSLLAISDTFTNKYKITDSINIDYTDIETGVFNYYCNNTSGIDLYVSAEHHDLWITRGCIIHNVNRYTDLPVLANKADSDSYYSGVIMDGDRHVTARKNQRFAHLNLSANRMFPKWEDNNSVTRVDYLVRTEPRGNWDTVNASDSLVFTIQPVAVNYKEMAGVLVKPFDKNSDTQTIEIPFPFPKSDKDSLRNHFVLQRVKANMGFTMNLPDSAFLGALQVNFKVLSPLYPSALTDTNLTFGVIKHDTTYNRAVTITNVVNNFPDSVKILTHVTVPVGTRIRAINDMNLNDKSVGTMTVKTFVNYNLNAYFDWNIAQTTTMDLGSDTFTIEEKGVRAFRRMSSKAFSFGLRVANHSNVNIRLLALFAPDSLRTTVFVDSMGTNQVNDLLSDNTGKAEAAGYVNLLGSQGVFIPRRDSVANDSITLNDRQMSRILSTNHGGMRWILRFMPSGRDSLTNVDNIKINSWIHLEGVNNMDSVVTAFE